MSPILSPFLFFPVLFRLPDNILKLDTVLLLVSDFTAEQLATVLHKVHVRYKATRL